MATSHKRLMQRYQPSAAATGMRSKLRITTASRGLALGRETESSMSMCQDLNKTMNPRLLRQLSNELLTTSPYAAAIPMPRSKSVSKMRQRAGRQTTPERYVRGHVNSLGKMQLGVGFMMGKYQKKRHVSEKPPLNQSISLKDGTRIGPPPLNLSFNNSFNTSISALPSIDSPLRAPKDSPTDSKLRLIASDLQSRLSQLISSGESDWKLEMSICSQAAKEVMALEKDLFAVLSIIIAKYEGWLTSFSDKLAKDAARTQSEILILQNSLLKEIEEKKAFKRKFEKVARENVELSRSCEIYQNKCFEYQEKLFDLADVHLDQFPPSEKSWRLLVTELDTYKTWKETATRELKAAQVKERKLLELLHAIKKRGFPIEQVYNEDVKKPPKSQRSLSESEIEEMEPIVTGPAAIRKRPEGVPALHMEAVARDVSSDSESSVQPSTLHDSENQFIPFKTLSNSSTHSNLTSSEKARPPVPAAKPSAIPQLHIPSKQDAEDGFHQEFMSKYEEFSESWRKQIDAQKH